jgi:hypothetical protein
MRPYAGRVTSPDAGRATSPDTATSPDAGGAASPARVKIGIRLGDETGDLGGWLADGAAFDAAGADALWIDLGPDSGLDPLAVTAALAAVTYRSLLVTRGPDDGEGPALARTLATVARLSGGRLRYLVDADPVRGSRMRTGVFRSTPGQIESYEYASESGPAERWLTAPAPENRPAWAEALREAAQQGWAGLVVPVHPRLLDLLRNPTVPGDRSDLQLSVG